MKKINRKYIIIAGGVLVVAAAVLSSYLKSIPVDSIQVKREAVISSVTEKGKLTSPGSKDIFCETAGKIIKVYVEEGDQVASGALLAQLDTSDIDAQINQVQGEIKALQGGALTAPSVGKSQIQQQQIAVEEAKASLNQAQREYDRTNNLYHEGAATKAELEVSQNNLDVKKKALAQAEAVLKMTQEQNKGSSIQYEGQKESLEAKLLSLQNQKEKSKIVCGFTGVVLTKIAEEGDYLNPGDKMFSVGDTKDLVIETYLITRDVYNVRKGDQAVVVFNTPGGKDIHVRGTITKISPATVEKISALGIVEEKVKVSVELKNKPDGINLFPGMEVDVDITTQKADQVLAVPTDTIFNDKGKSYVWIITNGQAKVMQVETGIEGDTLTEVKEGLKEGDTVVLNPHDPALKENIKVETKVETKVEIKD